MIGFMVRSLYRSHLWILFGDECHIG